MVTYMDMQPIKKGQDENHTMISVLSFFVAGIDGE